MAEVQQCLVPAGLWAIWKAQNATIFRGQRFYFENLWDAFSSLRRTMYYGVRVGGLRGFRKLDGVRILF
ncbi:hypothetical protein QJS10_CPB17g00828 [Acorus calamus]|uniref:Uncharacterized protein n=1 Tax=Acorus calamus TaxID=4465 RepID=A0AAV9CUN2_ACOCL|nr:hypothetical protein QJS10_CPB17g00828 [Acorus calamus]